MAANPGLKNSYWGVSSGNGETLGWGAPQQRMPWHAGQKCYLYLHRTYDTLFSFTEFSAWARSTQCKLEGWKTLINPRNNIDFFDFLGLVSRSKETTATTKNSKPPSVGKS